MTGLTHGEKVKAYAEAAMMIAWALVTWPFQAVMASNEMRRWQRAQRKKT